MHVEKNLSRLSELVRDWNYFIRRDGFFIALPKLYFELLQLPYRCIKYLVFVRSLHEPLPNMTSKISLEIKHFRASELELVRDIRRPSVANLCARRLVTGHLGLSAYHKGKLAGYA
jgi:hypothetical protein